MNFAPCTGKRGNVSSRRFPGIAYDVPEHILPAFDAWFERGEVAGEFVMSVLRNDLAGTVTRADHINAHRLKEIVDFLNMEAPANCWGSAEKVEAWHKRFHPPEANET